MSAQALLDFIDNFIGLDRACFAEYCNFSKATHFLRFAELYENN